MAFFYALQLKFTPYAIFAYKRLMNMYFRFLILFNNEKRLLSLYIRDFFIRLHVYFFNFRWYDCLFRDENL